MVGGFDKDAQAGSPVMGYGARDERGRGPKIEDAL